MEIDTGAAFIIVLRSICSVKLEPSTRKFRSATGQLMKLAGQITTNVQNGKSTKLLTLYVANKKNSWQRLDTSIFWRKLD